MYTVDTGVCVLHVTCKCLTYIHIYVCAQYTQDLHLFNTHSTVCMTAVMWRCTYNILSALCAHPIHVECTVCSGPHIHRYVHVRVQQHVHV